MKCQNCGSSRFDVFTASPVRVDIATGETFSSPCEDSTEIFCASCGETLPVEAAEWDKARDLAHNSERVTP